MVGGAAVTEEFHPGFRNSVAAYTVSLLNPKIIRDLDLARHGLTRGRAQARELPAARGRTILEGRRREEPSRRWRNSPRATPRGSPLTASRLDGDRRRAARRRAGNSAQCHRGRLARGAAGACCAARAWQPDRQARHGDAPGAAGSVREVGGRLSRHLVRERTRSRRRTASTAWSATMRARIRGRLGLRAPAPRVRRGQRQEGRLGTRHRRHGRDHPGDGQGGCRARRRDSHREPRFAK